MNQRRLTGSRPARSYVVKGHAAERVFLAKAERRLLGEQDAKADTAARPIAFRSLDVRFQAEHHPWLEQEILRLERQPSYFINRSLLRRKPHG
jgi:hypothetical protein